MKRIGLIVNPIAGMGGRVGLKGTDGAEILKIAKELGAEPMAPTRTIEALKRINHLKDKLEIITYPHDMGEKEARESGFRPIVIGYIKKGETSSSDTKNAAKEMLGQDVELILFAGGDGTARDVYEAIDKKIPCLGIPTGIKMHSGVFAVSPRQAGDLVAIFLGEDSIEIKEAEVMDIDEEAFRENRISAKLYGYLLVPYEKMMVQNPKAGSFAADIDSAREIAYELTENMDPDVTYIVGPGTTTAPIMERLGLRKTLLGVDVLRNGRILASDANESTLLETLRDHKAKIIVTVIGRQGFVFGRGNQQISPSVIRKVEKENIVIVATPEKIASLHGAPLLVDTGDEELDELMSGYHRIITGYGRSLIYKVQK